MKATILFPGDYFSLNSPNDNFTQELEAVIATDGLEAALFNYDDYIAGEPLILNKNPELLPELLIYRGWMMKPEQYERFYSDLVSLGFDPLTEPVCYERMHCFPNAAEMFDEQTPPFLVFPAIDGHVSVDAELVNKTFDKFMIKDYVKSVKGTGFPSCIETPISQSDLDGLIAKFIDLRGDLFTGGIVLKEFVNLKKYAGFTNEWREFLFWRGKKLGLSRNSQQPMDTPEPPDSYLSTRNIVICPFYTIDFAELEDGSWTIIEAGDGQVSGLAAADSPTRFYEELARSLKQIELLDD